MTTIDNLFHWVLNTSFSGTMLAGLIILLKSVFKHRFNAAWHYYVWFLLLVKLLIPYVPESPLSIFNVLNPDPETITSQINWAEGTGRGSEIKNEIQPSQPVFETTDLIGQNEQGPINLQSSDSLPVQKAKVDKPKSSLLSFNSKMLFYIWMGGILVLFGYTTIVNLSLYQKLKNQPVIKSNRITAIMDVCGQKMNIPRVPRLKIISGIKSPSLVGFCNTILLIPRNVLDKVSEEDLKNVIIHELSHLKRKDLLVNWIIVAMQIIHWFNPVMWYAFYRMRQDCEVACDAMALSYLKPDERKKYGETIINLLTTMSEAWWVPGTTAMVSGKSQIKERVTMIKLFNRKSTMWTAIALLLTVLVGCTGLTGASKSKVYRVPISSNNLYSIDLLKDWKAIQQKAGIPEATRIEDFETKYNYDGGIRELSFEVTGYKGGKLTHYRIERLPSKSIYQVTQSYVNQWLQYDQLVETESLVNMLNELNFRDLKPEGEFSWYVLRSSGMKDSYEVGDIRKFFVEENGKYVEVNKDMPIKGYSVASYGMVKVKTDKNEGFEQYEGRGMRYYFLSGSTVNSDEDLARTIDEKLNAIISNGPSLSSNPYDYIKDNQDYEEIVNMGKPALEYMLRKFEAGKENGLKEYIMAIACSEILGEKPGTGSWTSGRDWYNSHRGVLPGLLLRKGFEDYRLIKGKSGLPVYRPFYTAGYEYSPTGPRGEISGQDNRVWYKKGTEYFSVVNMLVGDLGDVKLEKMGEIHGYPAFITEDGKIAVWHEVHQIKDAENKDFDQRFTYGIELEQSGLSKAEFVKIVKSMQRLVWFEDIKGMQVDKGDL